MRDKYYPFGDPFTDKGFHPHRSSVRFNNNIISITDTIGTGSLWAYLCFGFRVLFLQRFYPPELTVGVVAVSIPRREN